MHNEFQYLQLGCPILNEIHFHGPRECVATGGPTWAQLAFGRAQNSMTCEQNAAWPDLPQGVQQHILALSANVCARRVSKAWRSASDAANDT